MQAICRPRRRRVVGSSPTWGAIVGAKFALLRLIFFCKPVKISRPPAALLLLSEKRLARRAFFRWCERTVLARFFLFCFLNCTCVTAASGSPKSDSFLGRGEIHTWSEQSAKERCLSGQSGSPKSDSFLGRGEIHTWSEQSPKEHCLGGLLIAALTRRLVKQHYFLFGGCERNDMNFDEAAPTRCLVKQHRFQSAVADGKV